MGTGASALLDKERQKPLDASDICDGDWEAAKQEISRMRKLLVQLNDQANANASSEETPLWTQGKNSNLHVQRAASDSNIISQEPLDPTSSDESPEGRALWSPSRPSRSVHRSVSLGNPSESTTESDLDPTSTDESPEGRALWSRQNSIGHHIEQSPHARHLLNQIRTKLYERYDNLRESFLKFDMDRSGYIGEDEFRLCMSNMGFHMTDEQFDLLQASYPHKEAIGQVDKGIGYLEFVHIMTDELQYIPGSGEDEENWNTHRQTTTAGSMYRPERPIPARTSSIDLSEIHTIFSQQIFGLFSSMKEAFKAADKDRSGYIEIDEFINLLRHTLEIDVDKSEAQDIMAVFDTNGDRKLAYSEFVKCLQAHSTSVF